MSTEGLSSLLDLDRVDLDEPSPFFFPLPLPNTLTLPKSVHEERIRSNADVFDFALTEADMAMLDGMPPCARNSPHPDTVDF